MAVKVGSVVVDLQARTSAFERSMQRAGNTVSDLGKKIFNLQNLVAAGGLAAGLGLVARRANAAATELAHMSARLGVSAEFLSSMEGTLQSLGLTMDQFGDVLQDMQERLEDAVRGGGEAREALEELGLSAKDLLAQGGERAFRTLLDRLREVDTEARKIFLADKLFADAGQKMVGIFKLSADAMDAQAEAARNLGLVITDEAAAAARALTNRFIMLGKIGQGFAQQMTQAMTPALNATAQAFVNMGSAANFGTMAGRQFGAMLSALVETGATVARFVNTLGESIGALGAAFATQLRGGEGMAVLRDFAGRQAERDAPFKKFIDDLQALPEPPQLMFDASQFEANLERGAANLDALTMKMDAAKTARVGMTDAQREANRVAQENLRLTEQARTPLEVLRDTHADLKERLDAGGISQRTFNVHLREAERAFRQHLEAANQNSDAMDAFEEKLRKQADAIAEQQRVMVERQAATQRMLFGILDRGLDGLLRGTKSVKDAFRDMVNDLTAQLTRLAAQEAFGKLFGGAGTTFGGGGVGGFSGLLGTIAGFLPGFQRGGSFTVGGSGGTDSQVVAMRATPGERVTVSPPGASAGGGPMVVQHLHFQGRPDPLAAQQVGAATALALRQAAERNA